MAGILAIVTLLPAAIVPAQASSERALYLHYTHTKETARIVFKRNGRFLQEGLNQLNVFLRDWRRNEPARMDPALFDLLWEVYQETGSNQPIHVVSAYRAPATNAMLASNSSGVASNSQHMNGKAIDFFIPGVSVNKLREIGFRKQVGGVGYYPSSGTAFVHLDTGSVRAWPRMTTAQLQQIFPDGRTLHIPSNGVPLSQEGYRLAQADWQRCQRVPCGSGPAANAGATQSAELAPRRTLMDLFTGGNNSQPQQQVAAQPQPAQQAPATRPVTSVPVQQVAAIEPPAPPARPAALGASSQTAAAPQNIPFAVVDADDIETQVAALSVSADDPAAPVPPAMSRAIAEMRAATPSAFAAPGDAATSDGALAIAALDNAPTPLPRPDFGPAATASAYAAPNVRIDTAPAGDPAPTPVMRPSMLAATPAPAATAEADAIATALISPQLGLESFADLFSGPILPVDGVPDAATANALASLQTREGELFAPDLDHVTETFLNPAAMSSTQFAFLTDPDNADFDPATQLGNGAHEYKFTRTASLAPSLGGADDASTIWVRLQ